MENIFSEKIASRILIYLFNNQNKIEFGYKLSKEIGCAHTCCNKNIHLLNGLGFINLIREGKIKMIILTEKRKEIANKLNDIALVLDKRQMPETEK